MGQYYMPLLRKPRGKRYVDTVFYAHQFDNGLKLIEHSYVGNNFVNEVWMQLIDTPSRVYWFGDYTRKGDAGLSAYYVKKYKRIFVNKNTDFYTVPFGSPNAPEDIQVLYPILVNHTKKEYVDIRSLRPVEKLFDYTPCPLPLLTATSNGRGSGDYDESQPGYEDIGIWSGDLLEVRKSALGLTDYAYRVIKFKSGLEEEN